MKDRSRKEVEELRDVSMSDVVLKLMGMLSPGSCPKIFEVTSRKRRDGVPAVPLGECLLKRFPDFFLRREDLVL